MQLFLIDSLHQIWKAKNQESETQKKAPRIPRILGA
jgi:hypothetical protein